MFFVYEEKKKIEKERGMTIIFFRGRGGGGGGGGGALFRCLSKGGHLPIFIIFYDFAVFSPNLC